jgi:FADH2 O2-dependent halogenase
MDTRVDVTVLGSGIGGSTVAAILARQGVSVALVDGARHPRFALGESTIGETSFLMRLLAARYDVPELAQVSTSAGIGAHASRRCGVKTNFGFVYHRPGEDHDPYEVTQCSVSEGPFGPESHLMRADIDQYLFQAAVRYGALPREGVRVAGVDIGAGEAAIALQSGETLRSDYVIDATGRTSVLANAFGLRDEPCRFHTDSRTIFTHMRGVKPYDAVEPSSGQPNLWHQGTLHHLFDGGWLWVIPFDNHADSLNPLCSVGLTLDPRVFPKDDTPAQAEFDAFLSRFPDIAWQFQDARAVRPWVSTGRLQYSAKQVVGDRFCLTSHAAGFIDALYSRGLTNTMEVVNALAWRLIAAAGDGDWSTERFGYLETLQQGLFGFHDDLVFSSFVGFRDYELWNAVNRTWLLGTMLGNVMLEDAYYRFVRSGDAGVLRELEESTHPGSPLPVSPGFNAMSALTRDLCTQVDEGSLAPQEAARRILACIREADFIAPSFRLGQRDTRCFNMSPGKMAKNALWCRRDAPPEIGSRMINASKGLVRMRLLGGR